MIGWVAFKVSLCFVLRFKPLKCDGQCLFLYYSVLALSVKRPSLQDRNVLGNVLIVDHYVKTIYIHYDSYFIMQYQTETKLKFNLLC